ncbi:hypothetical protein WJX72_006527 [[Myrmecia] bisecta]|uniref:Uncharacterized protein n=2 Tax=[Myrmecia] bisecta TaxID=41462 RepID=A0AAW1Q7A7_9CHLO
MEEAVEKVRSAWLPIFESVEGTFSTFLGASAYKTTSKSRCAMRPSGTPPGTIPLAMGFTESLQPSFAGSNSTFLGVDPTTGKVRLPPPNNPLAYALGKDTTIPPLHQVLAAPHLLYRLRALFPNCYVEEASGSKVPWRISLEHVSSQLVVTAGEWKGAAMVWLDEDFERDPTAVNDLLGISFFNHFEGREQGQDPTRRFWCMIVTAPGDKSTPYERENLVSAAVLNLHSKPVKDLKKAALREDNERHKMPNTPALVAPSPALIAYVNSVKSDGSLARLAEVVKVFSALFIDVTGLGIIGPGSSLGLTAAMHQNPDTGFAGRQFVQWYNINRGRVRWADKDELLRATWEEVSEPLLQAEVDDVIPFMACRLRTVFRTFNRGYDDATVANPKANPVIGDFGKLFIKLYTKAYMEWKARVQAGIAAGLPAVAYPRMERGAATPEQVAQLVATFLRLIWLFDDLRRMEMRLSAAADRNVASVENGQQKELTIRPQVYIVKPLADADTCPMAQLAKVLEFPHTTSSFLFRPDRTRDEWVPKYMDPLDHGHWDGQSSRTSQFNDRLNPYWQKAFPGSGSRFGTYLLKRGSIQSELARTGDLAAISERVNKLVQTAVRVAA